MKNITKKDAAKHLAKTLKLKHAQAYAAVKETLSFIETALAEGKTVEFRNFGVFTVRTTKARVGRNPKEPETPIIIPERIVVKFKAGKFLMEKLGK